MISIIVPVYRVEEYLNKCIESIVNQTYNELEIILVDDGSDDNCPQICDEWAKKDSRIKVIHKENGGLVSARQAGFRASTGDYVGFVDGDDWIEPDMYEYIANALRKTDADIAMSEFFFSYTDKEQKSEGCLSKEFYNREQLQSEVFPTMLFSGRYYRFGIYPNCWSKVIKRDLLEKNLLSVDTRIRLGEDIAFIYPCIMESESICHIDKALYHYRINSESMTQKYDSLLSDIYFLPYKVLEDKCKETGLDFSEQLAYYLLYLVNFVIRNEASINNTKSKKEKNEVLDKLLNNKRVIECMKTVDISILPAHTKLLINCFKTKRKLFLRFYITLLRRFL